MTLNSYGDFITLGGTPPLMSWCWRTILKVASWINLASTRLVLALFHPGRAGSSRCDRRTWRGRPPRPGIAEHRPGPPTVASQAWIRSRLAPSGPYRLCRRRRVKCSRFHPRDALLEPVTGADVAVNLCHGASVGLQNTFRNLGMTVFLPCSILPVCGTSGGQGPDFRVPPHVTW